MLKLILQLKMYWCNSIHSTAINLPSLETRILWVQLMPTPFFKKNLVIQNVDSFYVFSLFYFWFFLTCATFFFHFFILNLVIDSFLAIDSFLCIFYCLMYIIICIAFFFSLFFLCSFEFLHFFYKQMTYQTNFKISWEKNTIQIRWFVDIWWNSGITSRSQRCFTVLWYSL